MAIVIPGTAVNYPVALLAVGLKASCVPVGQNPKHGPQCIPVEIAWGTMGGTDKIVGLNIGNAGATRAFEDLCALHVDNSQCGADVEFIFTDTQITYTVPAYCPYALFPIFTKSLQFYIVSKIDGEIVESGDITRFLLFNFVPPPVVVPTSIEQDASAVANIATATLTTQIIAAAISGTINSINVFFSSGSAGLLGGGLVTWQLVDGSARVIATGQISGGDKSSWNVVLYAQTGLALRFQTGLQFKLAGDTTILGTFNVNIGYRQP